MANTCEVTMWASTKVRFGKLSFRYYTTQSNEVVIAAAARTPIRGFLNTTREIISSRLRTTVTDSVIKQAALPRELIDALYIVNSETNEQSVASELLRANVVLSSFHNDLSALRTAVDELKSGRANAIVLTATEDLRDSDFNNEAVERLKTCVSNGLYDAETIPITVREKQRQIETVTRDEHKIPDGNPTICIATSLALTTSQIAASQNIKPLSNLLVLASSQDYSELIHQILDPWGLKTLDIHHWELLNSTDDIDISPKLGSNSTCLHNNSLPGIFGQLVKSAGLLQLTHLTHTLRSNQFGCSLISGTDGFITSFLLKNSNEPNNRLPVLTLYTKNPCPLCDELIQELEHGFSNEYRLEKVLIDRKENVKYLRLYRYDIPILFLNGQYLCMHRLNSTLLKKKLKELKKGVKRI